MKYILLLSGGLNKTYNHSRYACDLGYAYQVMCERWKDEEYQIRIIYADGKDIDYAGKKLQTTAASRKNVLDQFDQWKRVIENGDEVYLVVSNHGGTDSGVGEIYLWGMEYLTLEELVEHMNQIPCCKYMILGQCFAGNILNLNLHHTLVLTANEPGKVSYARLNEECGYQYDEFLYQLFAGLNGKYPSGRSLSGGKQMCLDFEEAYEYAKMNDSWNPDHPDYSDLCRQIKRDDMSEIPQLKYFA